MKSYTENPNLSRKYTLLIDAEMLDKTAFGLIVNFERVFERRLPKANMNKWLYAAALDGGFPQKSENTIDAILIKSPDYKEMRNFDIDMLECEEPIKSYKNEAGCFKLYIKNAEEGIATTFLLFLNLFSKIKNDIDNLICMPAPEYIRNITNYAHSSDINISLLVMEPIMGYGFSQELLTYSLFYSLGISTEEIREHI